MTLAPLHRKFSAGVLALGLTLAAARADVQRYRYELDGRSGEPTYAAPLPSDGTPTGPWFEVERDSKGRMIRTADMRGGSKESEATYHYTGDSMTFDAGEIFLAGEHTASVKYQRGDKGFVTRVDRFTVGGDPTGYEVRTAGDAGVEDVYYAMDGKEKNRYVMNYSDGGVLLTYRRIVGSAYYEYLMDPSTGLAKSRKKIEDGNLVLKSVYAYDSNGEILREDGYDDKGAWFVSVEYSKGLIVRKNYKFADGTHKEINVTFDEKRQAKEARLSINDKLICTFTYDRLPDGTIKRTLALGPGGDLWAEYPDRMVNEVGQNGQALNRTDGIIHHAGNWW
jgi:hypothetical protein